MSHHEFLQPFDRYLKDHAESLSTNFFDKQTLIDFDGSFQCKKSLSDFTYEIDGFVNASYNCIDRHPQGNPAIYWETDEPNDKKEDNVLTFGQLLQLVSQLANTLLDFGIRKGDRVGICAGQTPFAIISMLACARIGAIHVVIFAGFSSEAIKDRLRDSEAKIMICTDIGKRGSKTIPIFQTISKALPPNIEKVIIAIRPSSVKELLEIHFNPKFDNTIYDTSKVAIKPYLDARCVYWDEVVTLQRPFCPPAKIHAEDPLFILHTSGSTGKPKGLLHSTGGYLIGAAYTTKYIFNLQPGNVFGCMADCGWITGHSYICYGPLSLGVTTVLFEPTPVYPSPARYVDAVKKWNINSFYTAPTAIRLLRKLADEVGTVKGTNCKVLGSVGEPINPEAWHYYNNRFGGNQCEIVDTYWQTETGSIVISPLPFVTKTKPGSATFPFFGISPKLLHPETYDEIKETEAEGLLAISEPWPSMARTIWRDHHRYLKTYIVNGMYLTGDTAFRDADGYIWIRGRIDDVVNVAGHRLSTAEVESALALHPDCAESASIGIPDEMSGQAVIISYLDNGFCSSKILFTNF
eukprot:NODE_785_length_3899_cov_1.070526.p1 type:complete len:578 gc:universal NODE_785_length_3899_cov_1.070526:248-1981(+)